MDNIVLFWTSLIGLYFFYHLFYWKIKRVPTLSLMSFGLSSVYLMEALDVVKYSNMAEYYREMKTKRYNFAGVMTSIRAVLIIKDMNIIDDLLTEHHMLFDDEGYQHTDMYGPQVGDLIIVKGTCWRQMRNILRPTHLCSKLNLLFKRVVDVTEYLLDAIDDCASRDADIDVKELFTCFTTDVICYHCYNVNCYSYRRSPADFCTRDLDKLSVLGYRSVEESLSRKLYKAIRKYIKYRVDGRYKEMDFIEWNDYMFEWSKEREGEENLRLYEMIDRMFLFFQHCFDVSSTTLHFAIYELCQNPHIQEKVREEINTVLQKYNGKMSEDTLRRMEYLDQVIDETLRLYPPAANLVKRTMKKGCKLKGTNFNVSTSTDVIIPTFCLQRDPDHFPDPEKFDPERFDSSQPTKNPPIFMPFGAGQIECKSIQACMVQIKIGLVQILRNFRLTMSSNTNLPLRLTPQSFLMCEDVLYVKAKKI